MDNNALFKIGYGLYVLTAKEGDKDNGCIINTILQVTSANPLTGVVALNKKNYTHDMVMRTKEFNVSVLTTDTPFFVFEHFGFQSGSSVNKFAECKEEFRGKNNILYIPKYTNAYMSFKVTDTIDFGSHTLFRADITDAEVIGGGESVTYAYYQKNIKPKPQPAEKSGYCCNICGYVYEGDVLPDDFICPLCKHGASDFTKI